jgi:hypothetical protein
MSTERVIHRMLLDILPGAQLGKSCNDLTSPFVAALPVCQHGMHTFQSRVRLGKMFATAPWFSL